MIRLRPITVTDYHGICQLIGAFTRNVGLRPS